MPALKKQAVSTVNANFADQFEVEVDAPNYPPGRSTSTQSAIPSGRRPNVPNFSDNTADFKAAGSTLNSRNSFAPPKPLSGVGVRVATTSPGATLALSPGFRLPVNRTARNPLLAVAIPNPIVLVSGLLAIMLVGFVLLSNMVQWWQTWQDDLTYGRPRTFQVDTWVGHNEQNGHPTHLIAQNLDRQISIIEYPGGDPTKARVLVGPRLFGKNDDLAPIKLRLVDVNGDGHVDLIATINGQHIIYINENGQFRLLRQDERSQVNLPNNL